jgi:hypothetical protein
MTQPVLGDALDDCRDIRDAAASYADSHAASWTNPGRKTAELELTPCFAAHVRQTTIGEPLPHE